MSKNNNFPSKEVFHRMNYLLQISELTSKQMSTKQLANFYTNLTVSISKKAVLRLDSEIKKTICKSCNQYLIPGDTCKVHVRRKTVIYKCLVCSMKKRFMCRPNNLEDDSKKIQNSDVIEESKTTLN